MDNYIMLNGKKIPLSEESANNIQKSLQPEPILIGDDNSQHKLRCDSFVEIGRGAVPEQLKSKCLVVSKGIKIVVEKNDDFIFSQRILFFEE